MEKFLPNSIFCNFKNGQKPIFELGKLQKIAKNAISRKKIIYLISRVFFLAWTFLNFLVHYVHACNVIHKVVLEVEYVGII